jgi:putative transposase
MPWAETNPMKERVRFVKDFHNGLWTMSELCQRYGISRKTGYKWMQRHDQEGRPGLRDRSRAPHYCPHKIPDEVAQAILEVRRQHPSCGPRKIVAWLYDRRRDLAMPSISTAGDLLSRAGLVRRRRRRRRPQHPGQVPIRTRRPNDLWTADFKGHFHARDGLYCYPLTVADQHSRFLLGCDALLSTKGDGVRRSLERLFREFGLPEAIRTDNGVPFATTGIHGLSKLNVWWMRLGIQHQRIAPAHPEQNGAHERMHRTLKQEATRPPAANRTRQQAAFNRFQRIYNDERPHEALKDRPPTAVYRCSTQMYPRRLPAVEYPGHFFVRRVSTAGTFRFFSHQLFSSHALEHLDIGLEEVDNGIWSIQFCNVLIARLDERDFRIYG